MLNGAQRHNAIHSYTKVTTTCNVVTEQSATLRIIGARRGTMKHLNVIRFSDNAKLRAMKHVKRNAYRLRRVSKHM